MRYDDQVVDQVQAANDIVEVISQYVPLKRGGRNFKGLCPFHGEKTPSFMVNPEKQIFHCFGCSAGGDVLTFIMRYENVTFPEALRQLAERGHVRLPALEESKGGGAPSENEQLYEIGRLAEEYYHAAFLGPQGKAAREYYLKRGFKPEAAKELKLGWAEDSWRGLFDFLSKKGYPEGLLVKSGLVHRSPKGPLYDAFRGRLMFPIHNLQGKVIGFGGRIIAESTTGGPKYLNSPETSIFVKRRELFGLHAAKRFIDREKPQLVVVEGYLDFLRLYQEGFKTVVATLGTALTEDHVTVLKRFAEEAVVIYDGDKAGEAASMRGLEVFLEGGMSVKLVRMPAGYDPDDFVRKEGVDAFRKQVAEARDFFDYKLEILLSRYDARDSLGLMRITNEFLETFLKIKNPVLLDRYLRKLAGSLGVEENSLRSELGKLLKKTSGQVRPAAAAEQAPKAASKAPREEILLLALAVEDPRMREILMEETQVEDFSDRSLYEFYQIIGEGSQSAAAAFSWPRLLQRLQNDEVRQSVLSYLSQDWSAEEKEKVFRDCLKTLKNRQLDRRREELRRSIAKAEREGNQDRILSLAREYQELLREPSAEV